MRNVLVVPIVVNMLQVVHALAVQQTVQACVVQHVNMYAIILLQDNAFFL